MYYLYNKKEGADQLLLMFTFVCVYAKSGFLMTWFIFQKTEEQNARYQLELRARDDFLHMSEEDARQHARNFTLFEQQIAEKDNIIRFRYSLAHFKDEIQKKSMSGSAMAKW